MNSFNAFPPRKWEELSLFNLVEMFYNYMIHIHKQLPHPICKAFLVFNSPLKQNLIIFFYHAKMKSLNSDLVTGLQIKRILCMCPINNIRIVNRRKIWSLDPSHMYMHTLYNCSCHRSLTINVGNLIKYYY